MQRSLTSTLTPFHHLLPLPGKLFSGCLLLSLSSQRIYHLLRGCWWPSSRARATSISPKYHISLLLFTLQHCPLLHVPGYVFVCLLVAHTGAGAPWRQSLSLVYRGILITCSTASHFVNSQYTSVEWVDNFFLPRSLCLNTTRLCSINFPSILSSQIFPNSVLSF